MAGFVNVSTAVFSKREQLPGHAPNLVVMQTTSSQNCHLGQSRPPHLSARWTTPSHLVVLHATPTHLSVRLITPPYTCQSSRSHLHPNVSGGDHASTPAGQRAHSPLHLFRQGNHAPKPVSQGDLLKISLLDLP